MRFILQQLLSSLYILINELLALGTTRAVEEDEYCIKINDVILKSVVIEDYDLVLVVHHRQLLLSEEQSFVVAFFHLLKILNH